MFVNVLRVGELAKKFFNVDVDVTVLKENGSPNNGEMILKTKECLALGAKRIAEASFEYDGLFCSVDILIKNDDNTYNIYEVKSSKRNLKENSLYNGVKERYVIDSAYQQYVLENSGIKVNKVFVVLLSETYVMGKEFELDKYFVCCDVTKYTTEKQLLVKDMLNEIGIVLSCDTEPKTVFIKNCQKCEYFEYCSKGVVSPSPFDVYGLNFTDKCD